MLLLVVHAGEEGRDDGCGPREAAARIRRERQLPVSLKKT